MTKLETFYLRLPTLLQHLACSYQGWDIRRERYTAEFFQMLAAYQERASWGAEQIAQYRDRRLREFVAHSYKTVPYYRRHMTQWGIVPDDIGGLLDLGELPLLSKEQVQRQSQLMWSEAVPAKQRILAHTSGTTGGGLQFAVTLRAVQEQWATWWRFRSWHGIQMGVWCGHLMGRSVVPLHQQRPPFWRYALPLRQIMFSGYHLNEANMSAYVAELRRRQPPWLHGYPSLLALLAAYLVQTGQDLGYAVRWVTTGAENLLPQQEQLIKQAFGVKPRQHYGMAEGVANISECERGRMHVDEDFAAVEFLPQMDGGSYKVIGTNFTNAATPLLRYDVQDLVTVEGDACTCGRPGRLVARVDGRKEDYIVLANGCRLGRLDHIFKDLTNIKEAQIYQRVPGSITIRVVRGPYYSPEDEFRLRQEARHRIGMETAINISYVDILERSRTGKLRFVISELPQGKIAATKENAYTER